MTCASDALLFGPWLDRWGLTTDGAPFATATARLIRVRRGGTALMLKLSETPESRRGAELMRWWDGDGAAFVAAADGPALLIERAEGTCNLAAMARQGRDDDACRILCDTARRLHRPRGDAPPGLMPLDRWFHDLWPFAAAQGGPWVRAAEAARALLQAPRNIVALHGDLHHGNVLDFGARGWLAIDPHALVGERGFDFGNIFANPDLDDPVPPLATQPAIFARRVDIVARAAHMDRSRLLMWILARSGLSAAWFAQDGDPLIGVERAIADMAAAALDC